MQKQYSCTIDDLLYGIHNRANGPRERLDGLFVYPAKYVNPVVAAIAFGHPDGNKARLKWLLDLAELKASKLRPTPPQGLLGSGLARKQEFTEWDIRFLLAVAFIVRSQIPGSKSTDAQKLAIADAVTGDEIAAVSLLKHDIDLFEPDLPSHVDDIDVANLSYMDVVRYVRGRIGRKPSRSVIYKVFPKAGTRKFSKNDCEMLIKRLTLSKK